MKKSLIFITSLTVVITGAVAMEYVGKIKDENGDNEQLIMKIEPGKQLQFFEKFNLLQYNSEEEKVTVNLHQKEYNVKPKL